MQGCTPNREAAGDSPQASSFSSNEEGLVSLGNDHLTSLSSNTAFPKGSGRIEDASGESPAAPLAKVFTVRLHIIRTLFVRKHPGAMLRLLGAILGSLGRRWGHLGGSWGSLGVVLGGLGAVLGGSWRGLGRSWDALGATYRAI